MNRQQVMAFIADLKKMRTAANDDLAVEAINVYPQWSGDSIEYKVDDRVIFNNVLYKVLIDHTSQTDWNPVAAASLFTKVLTSDSGKALPWVQPDSTNPYMQGDKVLHKDATWVSDVDNNVWEPGVYGWTQIN